MSRKGVAVAAVLAGGAAAGYAVWRLRRASRAEIERLACILGWEPGRVVADVGAGRGALAVEAGRRVGRQGHVYAAEVEPAKVRKVRRRAEGSGLENLTAVETDQSGGGMPADACDAILLRGSYHHFSDPAAMTVALHRALRPGGTLAVIDFEPRWWLSLLAPLKGVPQDRGGHGIPREVLVRELEDAGFSITGIIPRWRWDTYCVVAQKPAGN